VEQDKETGLFILILTEDECGHSHGRLSNVAHTASEGRSLDRNSTFTLSSHSAKCLTEMWHLWRGTLMNREISLEVAFSIANYRDCKRPREGKVVLKSQKGAFPQLLPRESRCTWQHRLIPERLQPKGTETWVPWIWFSCTPQCPLFT
jgi:hypothetical protein